MFRRSLLLLILLIIILFMSCEQNTIILPKICTEEPDLPFDKVQLIFETDTVTQQIITLDKKGYLFGDNIIIQQNGIRKNAQLSGYICKDKKLFVSVWFNDPQDTSQIQIEGYIEGNIASADIFYCPYSGSNCQFIKIGYFYGSYAGGSGAGHFETPMFSGLLRYGPGK